MYVCIEGGRRARGKRGARGGRKKERKEGWTVKNFGNKKVSRNMGVEVRPFMDGREGDFSFEKTGEERRRVNVLLRVGLERITGEKGE